MSQGLANRLESAEVRSLETMASFSIDDSEDETKALEIRNNLDELDSLIKQTSTIAKSCTPIKQKAFKLEIKPQADDLPFQWHTWVLSNQNRYKHLNILAIALAIFSVGYYFGQQSCLSPCEI